MNKEQKALFNELTELQQRFCINMLSGKYSQRQAYVDAGGTAINDESRDSISSRMLSDAKVKAYMDSMKESMVKAAVMSREEMLERLTTFARGNMSDLVEFGEYEIGEEDGQPIIQATWKIKGSAKQDENQMVTISELTAGRDGIKIKQHSPLQAMKQIADMEGFNAPKELNINKAEELIPWDDLNAGTDKKD
jgi:phage terminase small subunit